MTDVEGLLNHSAPRSSRGSRLLQRVGVPALTVVTVLASTVFGFARPVAGDAISDAKAKAAAIEAQLTQAQNEMSALSQQYDEAKFHLGQINSNIATTKANIAADQQQVSKDKATLAKAAVANYISDGTAAAQNSIFSGNEETAGATTEYNQIAEGDISLAVDNLHTAENSLGAQVAQLQNEQQQAQSQVTTEQNAVSQNAQAIDQQKNALAQEQGQIAAARSATARGRGCSSGTSSCCQTSSCSCCCCCRRCRSCSSARLLWFLGRWQQPRRVVTGCTTADGRRRCRSGPGGREPDRRSLRLGRRVPEGVRRSRLRLLRPHSLVLGAGRGRLAALLRRPDVRFGPGADQ